MCKKLQNGFLTKYLEDSFIKLSLKIFRTTILFPLANPVSNRITPALTSALSTMMNLKKISRIFIMISRKSRRKMKIIVKFFGPFFRFWTFQQKSMTEGLQVSCLIKECHIWIEIYRLNNFMLQSIRKFHILPVQKQI